MTLLVTYGIDDEIDDEKQAIIPCIESLCYFFQIIYCI